MHKTVGELRGSLTNTQLAHWIAMFNLYPMGEEAMDVRFGLLLAQLQAGLATVSVKRGKTVKFCQIFKREFWVKPSSQERLNEKIMTAFKALGMKG